MNSADYAIPDTDPVMVAWMRYKASPSFASAREWAQIPQHVDGAMWAAFLSGWDAHRRKEGA